jgi:hypothetical protein
MPLVGKELRTAGCMMQAASSGATLFLETLFASFIFDLSCSYRLCSLSPSCAELSECSILNPAGVIS